MRIKDITHSEKLVKLSQCSGNLEKNALSEYMTYGKVNQSDQSENILLIKFL